MPRRQRVLPWRAAVAAAAWLLLAVGLAALGAWQVERRAWKHRLITTVQERIDAAPSAAPGSAEWPGINADSAAYRRVRVTGRFLNDRETLVQAVTDLGSGYWVLTPMATPGFTVLVNRGFIPAEKREPASRAAGEPTGPVTVIGLLRITEPHGGFLRRNDPAHGRWYSRDVAAIAAARGLGGPVAPYFIDADAAPNPGGWPAGGLTVVRFPDNHLIYALTWFTLAAFAGWAAWRTLAETRREGEDAAQ